MKNISIIGSGTMGIGIAQSCLLAGYAVIVYDPVSDALEKGRNTLLQNLTKSKEKLNLTDAQLSGVLGSVRFETNLSETFQSEIIIEAVIENIEVKKNLFSEISKNINDQTLLATNTSSLSITSIASASRNPKQVLGIHFFNPAHIMKLVELIKGEWTEEYYVQQAVEWVRSLKKVPVIAKDTPGFIVNRIARPYYGEALKILGSRTADVETIDAILKNIGGFKMGPFELLDLIGIDINFEVTQSVYHAYFQDPKYRPHIIQQRMVEAGKLGRKSNQGFYKYE